MCGGTFHRIHSCPFPCLLPHNLPPSHTFTQHTTHKLYTPHTYSIDTPHISTHPPTTTHYTPQIYSLHTLHIHTYACTAYFRTPIHIQILYTSANHTHPPVTHSHTYLHTTTYYTHPHIHPCPQIHICIAKSTAPTPTFLLVS